MALKIKHQEVEFGVGDRVKVHQRVKEAEKSRDVIFDGMVIAIRGRGDQRTFTVRRIGEAGIGIERIFPIALPSITKIQVVKKGMEGVRRAKLYYTRQKPPTEVEMIYKKAAKRLASKKK